MPFLGKAKLFLIAVYTMIDYCVVSKNSRNSLGGKKEKRNLNLASTGIFKRQSVQSLFVCNQITRLLEHRIE